MQVHPTKEQWLISRVINKTNEKLFGTALDLSKSVISYYDLYYYVPKIVNNSMMRRENGNPIYTKAIITLNPCYEDRVITRGTIQIEYDLAKDELITDTVHLIKMVKELEKRAKPEDITDIINAAPDYDAEFDQIQAVADQAAASLSKEKEEAVSGIVSAGEKKGKAKQIVEQIAAEKPELTTSVEIIREYFKRRTNQ